MMFIPLIPLPKGELKGDVKKERKKIRDKPLKGGIYVL
jgi:hypothetical protein